MRFVRGIVLALVLTNPLLAADRISLKVYPRWQHGVRATVRVTILVPRDATNRQVCVVIDGANFYRSSCWEHIGEGARYENTIYYPDIPPGRYAAGAELVWVDKDGRAQHAYTRPEEFRILGPGEELEPDQ